MHLTAASIFFSAVNAEVHQLTADNFKKFIAENDNTLVKFFAPWCGHCKKMAPDYEAASDLVPEGFKLAEVDVTEEQALGEEFGIKGFPTLKFFQAGQAVDYDGGRSKDDIVRYATMMTTDAITAVDSVAEAKEQRGGIPAFIAEVAAGTPESEIFSIIANTNRMLGKFYTVESKANKITVVRDDGEAQVDFSDQDGLVARLKAEKLALFGRVSGENFGDYMETGLDMVWFAGDSAQKAAIQGEVEAAAKQFRAKYNFVHIDSAEFEKQIEGMLGLSPSDLPKLVRTLDGPGKFILDGEISASNISAWIKKQEDGEITPTLKSEDVPETNSDPVKIVVGKNFDEIITDDKDVLIMIHAPWCGHCKKMAPEFEAAAAVVAQKSPNTVLAMMDGTANEISNTHYTYTGFPTVYFKPAGKSTPELYRGEREVAGILKFLSERVATPFEYEVPAKVEDDEL